MPRQSKTDRILAAREAAVEVDYNRATLEADRLERELDVVRSLRRELAAAPKRTRTKRLVPANTQPATATAA